MLVDELQGIKLVQEKFPDANDDIAGYMLWNCTAFPFDTMEGTRKQLEDLNKKSNGDIQKALDISHEDFEQEIKSVCEAIDEREREQV